VRLVCGSVSSCMSSLLAISLGNMVWGMRLVFCLSSGHDSLAVAMLEVKFGHGRWLEDWPLGS